VVRGSFTLREFDIAMHLRTSTTRTGSCGLCSDNLSWCAIRLE
jgi:hypothetical protein